MSTAGTVNASANVNTSAVALREMRWWDIDPVLTLEQRLFPEDAWSEGMFWSELARARGPHATRRYLVAATGDGELVGYGGLVAVDRTGDIQTIGVLPSHRGTGLAARLLTALLAAATQDFDCHEVLLEVRVDNTPARRLYERFGFVPIGVRRGYYQPGNIDALVMRNDRPGSSATGGEGKP
ncbi:ribosomal protein S18-alanine N-acetyltransferase [Streptomyces sp. N2-109]|uniref:Ribosomal protein S18-alanine N-acetyltransferase n=1 Tax=Streptomyces gossypii TaxID=2883101 RepID=A0ABT2JYG4_9ACTN|nr:ribosomal protein S18-alanine N-acetyltransferase [Streptomyces gossypii]MCT2592299.1 ribosomal protein S18-alanine N-acetyltransferase [Streptomyces gossypii]